VDTINLTTQRGHPTRNVVFICFWEDVLYYEVVSVRPIWQREIIYPLINFLTNPSARRGNKNQ